MIGTAFWYLHTDQWRYDRYRADALTSPLAKGEFAGKHTVDLLAQVGRLGWMPFYAARSTATRSTSPTRPWPPSRRTRPATWPSELAGGRLKFAGTRPGRAARTGRGC